MSESADSDSKSGPHKYSKAFENMVSEGADDIVGLLAYALLKQNIREDASRGVHIDGALRDPTPITVNLYRSSAEQRLSAFAASAIDEARGEIQESAVLSAVQQLESNLTAHVTNRTGVGSAILTNIAAWAVTGFITIIIILLLAVSGAGERMLNGVSASLEHAVTPEGQTGSAGSQQGQAGQ